MANSWPTADPHGQHSVESDLCPSSESIQRLCIIAEKSGLSQTVNTLRVKAAPRAVVNKMMAHGFRVDEVARYAVSFRQPLRGPLLFGEEYGKERLFRPRVREQAALFRVPAVVLNEIGPNHLLAEK